MSGNRRVVTQINIVAKRFEETLKFYRLLGLDLPEPMNQPPGALHAPANVDTGVVFEIDNEFLARLYSAPWRTPFGGRSLLLTVSVGTGEEVDDAYATLMAAGYHGRQMEKAGLKVNFRKTTEFIVPEEFQNKLDEIPALKTAFDALTPGRQRAYILLFFCTQTIQNSGVKG
jgi:hypothetical protein